MSSKAAERMGNPPLTAPKSWASLGDVTEPKRRIIGALIKGRSRRHQLSRAPGQDPRPERGTQSPHS